MIATIKGCIDIVNFLLNKGADPNIQNIQEETNDTNPKRAKIRAGTNVSNAKIGRAHV